MSVTVPRNGLRKGTATEHGAFVLDLQRKTTSRLPESIRGEEREVKESTTITCIFVTVKVCCYKHTNVGYTYLQQYMAIVRISIIEKIIN